jgi:hypothetical protein
MHHHRVDADQLHQHDIAREALFQAFVHHGVAAVLDDDGLAAKLLDVGQGLDQDEGDIVCSFLGQTHGG